MGLNKLLPGPCQQTLRSILRISIPAGRTSRQSAQNGGDGCGTPGGVPVVVCDRGGYRCGRPVSARGGRELLSRVVPAQGVPEEQAPSDRGAGQAGSGRRGDVGQGGSGGPDGHGRLAAGGFAAGRAGRGCLIRPMAGFAAAEMRSTAGESARARPTTSRRPPGARSPGMRARVPARSRWCSTATIVIRSAPPSSAADANSAKPHQRMLTCGQRPGARLPWRPCPHQRLSR
jgi:hypothetical protein